MLDPPGVPRAELGDTMKPKERLRELDEEENGDQATSPPVQRGPGYPGDGLCSFSTDSAGNRVRLKSPTHVPPCRANYWQWRLEKDNEAVAGAAAAPCTHSWW